MSEKALISDLTWRSLEAQKVLFAGMPIFEVREIPTMLRATTRITEDKIHVASFGVIADNETKLKEFASLCKARKTSVVSVEEKNEWRWNHSYMCLLGWWKAARRNGATKIGARISADKKKAATLASAEIIRTRWPLPSKDWPTKVLLMEAKLSLNAAKSVLGKRPIAQYNYQAAQKRKERRNAKN